MVIFNSYVKLPEGYQRTNMLSAVTMSTSEIPGLGLSTRCHSQARRSCDKEFVKSSLEKDWGSPFQGSHDEMVQNPQSKSLIIVIR